MCGSSAPKSYGSGGSVNAISFSCVFFLGPTRSLIGADEHSDLAGFDCGIRVAPRALRPVSSDETRQNRDENDEDHHYLDVLVDARNIAAKKVSDPEHAPDPEYRTEDVECDELSELHSSDAGDHRRKRADDRHELG